MSPHDIPPSQAEPLTADERAWAERLRKIGPHAGPSSALDAKILAAARAAVAKHPQRSVSRRRWPALIGAAASLVIVVGLAWQLQPLLRSRPSLGEAPPNAPLPHSEGSLSADVLAAANPVAKTAVDNPPPPPGPARPPSPHRSLPIPPSPPTIADLPAAPPAPRPAAKFGDDAIPPYSGYAGRIAARQSASKAAANDATAPAPAEERREREAAASPQPFPAQSADAAMDAMPAPAIREQRAVAPAREASSRAATASPQRSAPAPVAVDNTRHRIESSGSRIAHADAPVGDDARLAPAAWLQRIRDRRDADDLDGARESLALFRESHPRIRLPDDLARLDE